MDGINNAWIVIPSEPHNHHKGFIQMAYLFKRLWQPLRAQDILNQLASPRKGEEYVSFSTR